VKSRAQRRAEQTQRSIEGLKKAAKDWNNKSEAQKKAERRWGNRWLERSLSHNLRKRLGGYVISQNQTDNTAKRMLDIGVNANGKCYCS